MTYGKTLFLIDENATIGGLAGGLSDLAMLDATDVDLERLSVPSLSLTGARITKMSAARGASLVAVGVSDATTLLDLGVVGQSVRPGVPLLYLGVNSPSATPFPAPGRILHHVLAPSDYSVRSGCLTSCLMRVARRGAQVVTLMHVPDARLARDCVPTRAGELGRVDADWVDQLKAMLFSAGGGGARCVSPAGGSAGFELMTPGVSLVLVGESRRAEITKAYIAASAHLLRKQHDVPALMLTAESCSTAPRLHGAA